MNSSSSAADKGVPPDSDHDVVPPVVEWLVAALLALGGLAVALGGSAVLWLSDETLIADVIADGVAQGDIRIDALTPAQLTDIAVSTSFWAGIGLVLTGLAIFAVAVLYVVARRRARRTTGPSSGRGRLFSNAVLGAFATSLLSFVPASPILGGAVAGHVHRKQASGPTKAGALSGLFAGLPVVAVLFFLAVGLVVGFGNAGVGLGIVVGLGFLVGIVATLIYFVGLGALGGYFAALIANDGSRAQERLDESGEPEVESR